MGCIEFNWVGLVGLDWITSILTTKDTRLPRLGMRLSDGARQVSVDQCCHQRRKDEKRTMTVLFQVRYRREQNPLHLTSPKYQRQPTTPRPDVELNTERPFPSLRQVRQKNTPAYPHRPPVYQHRHTVVPAC